MACPAQEVEGESSINADYWHPVREKLKAKYGKDLFVLGWIGAAGDQSPHIRFRRQAEDRMRELRGLSRLEEISSRILNAWETAYAGAVQEKHTDVVFEHRVEQLDLPRRAVTKKEYEETQAEVAKLEKQTQALPQKGMARRCPQALRTTTGGHDQAVFGRGSCHSLG